MCLYCVIMASHTLANILFVALGSGIGGASRYMLSKFIQENSTSGFPLGTLIVNITGCFMLGIIYALIEKGCEMGDGMKLFLTVGLCGGFTTFSTFMNDNLLMLNDSKLLWSIIYLIASVAGGFLLLYAGYRLINYLL